MKINLRYLRYSLFFVSFLIFTYAVQVFVQNFNINTAIKWIDKTQNNLSWDTLWMKLYYKSFLDSKYVVYFFKHKQWVKFNDEFLIKIENNNSEQKDKIVLDKIYKKKYNRSMKENRNLFFYNLKNLFTNK